MHKLAQAAEKLAGSVNRNEYLFFKLITEDLNNPKTQQCNFIELKVNDIFFRREPETLGVVMNQYGFPLFKVAEAPTMSGRMYAYPSYNHNNGLEFSKVKTLIKEKF